MAEDKEPIEVEPVRPDEMPADLAIRPGFAGIESLEIMQRRQEIIEILLANALKKTTARHWLNYGDIPSGPNKGHPTDPRPEDEAAVVIARSLGISYRWEPMGDGPEHWLERKKPNGEYELLVKIRGACFGQILEEIGSCSSDDGLLKHSKRAEEKGKRALFSDVLKKAQANGLVRLVQAFGGRAVTWEDLAGAGVKREDCDRVEFAESEEAAAKGATTGASGRRCPKCGKAMKLRKRSEDGAPFLGCTGYPACRHIEQVAQEKPAAAAQASQDTPEPAPVADTPSQAEPPVSGHPGEESEADREDLQNQVAEALGRAGAETDGQAQLKYGAWKAARRKASLPEITATHWKDLETPDMGQFLAWLQT